jgi:hypothetical protein
MDEMPHWHFVHHIGSVWEFDVEINYPKIASESMVKYAKKVVTHAIIVTFRA